MDPSLKKRVDQAWDECKDWIVEFDGSPTITLLVDIPSDAVLPALGALAQQSENFRITTISAAHPDLPEFVPLESLSSSLALLQEGKIVEVSANYTVRLEAFDLDIHLIIHWLKNQKVALELVWWNDQIFSDESDNRAQFASLMDYFINLQGLFSAPNLFVSPEAGQDPIQEADAWVEI